MKKEEKLFAVYLGGEAPRANIELHDVVFVTGSSLTDTYPKLIKKWFGYPEKIPHIDSYIELNYADGFQVQLVPTIDMRSSEYKLYFVNFGGYTENLFGEVHQSAFYVAKNKAEATKRARSELCVGTIQTHLDDHLEVEGLIEFGSYDVDEILEIENVDGYYLNLIPAKSSKTSLACPGNIKIKVDEYVNR